MTGAPTIRGWKALALLAAILAVVLLLIPHSADHHVAALYLLVPIFLCAALIEEPGTYSPRNDHGFAPTRHVTTTLFQRPPPSQA